LSPPSLMVRFVLPIAMLTWAAAVPGQAQIHIENPYVAFTEADSTWAELPASRSWGHVTAVHPGTDGRTIWVLDRCGATGCIGREEVDMVFQFDLDGRLLRSFGAGLFAVPHGLHVDFEGNVWVTDAAYLTSPREGVGHVVRKFSPEGKLLLTLGEWGVGGDGPGHFYRPSDVLVAPDGSVFVADGHAGYPEEGGNSRIVKFSPDGSFLMEWGSWGSAIGQFRELHALAMDSRGRLFVGDRGNSRIQIFDQEGGHLATWTQFGSPSGLYIDADDLLYVADSDSNSQRNPGWRRGIYIGSAADGRVTGFILDPEPNPDGGVSSGAEGVAVDANGTLYTAEVIPRVLRRFPPR
jgi:hypothetical protein